MKKFMRKLLAAALVALVLVVIGLWLADRPIDAIPKVPETMGAIAFNPKLGPKTPQEVREYVERRAGRSWTGRKTMSDDRESQVWEEPLSTLLRRWGFTPEMTQEEIDVVLREREAVWAFMENEQTVRSQIRSWLYWIRSWVWA